jgi:hypothetical protein
MFTRALTWKLTKLVANTMTPASRSDKLFGVCLTGQYRVNVDRDILDGLSDFPGWAKCLYAEMAAEKEVPWWR